MKTKACIQCGEEKHEDEFLWKNRMTRRGNRCRTCRLANYKENPHRARERASAYYYAHKEEVNRKSRAHRESSHARQLLSGARARARKQGVPFSLTEASISIPRVCPVLGIPLVMARGKCSEASPSIDRIVPSLGYVEGNVLVVSFKANTIKSNATTEELFRVAEFYSALAVGVTAQAGLGEEVAA